MTDIYLFEFIVLFLLISAAALKAYIHVFALQFNDSIYSHEPKLNPRLSWKNKWKLDISGNPIEKNGKRVEKFFGSSTFLVFLTDTWHLLNFLHSLCLLTIPVVMILFFDSLWYLFAITLSECPVIFFFSAIITLKVFYGLFGEIVMRLITTK